VPKVVEVVLVINPVVAPIKDGDKEMVGDGLALLVIPLEEVAPITLQRSKI
jgi:hypothetical protein